MKANTAVIPAKAGITSKRSLQKNKAPREAGPCRYAGARGSARDDADHAALLEALDREVDLAVDQREQRMVAADADAGARMELGTADRLRSEYNRGQNIQNTAFSFSGRIIVTLHSI